MAAAGEVVDGYRPRARALCAPLVAQVAGRLRRAFGGEPLRRDAEALHPRSLRRERGRQPTRLLGAAQPGGCLVDSADPGTPRPIVRRGRARRMAFGVWSAR